MADLDVCKQSNIRGSLLKMKFPLILNYNKEILLNMIKNIDLELPGAGKKVSYDIDGDKSIITKAQSGAKKCPKR